jgi:hypothetical protein
MSLGSRLVTVCACVAALLVCAQTAQAACTRSTPAHTTFADNPADGNGAPELTSVTVSIDAACTFSMDPGVGPDAAVGVILTFIDRDGNPSTGAQAPQGADVAVFSVGEPGVPPFFGVWDGEDFEIAGEAAPANVGGFSAKVDELGIVPGARTSTWVWSASLSGDDDDEGGFDAAPEIETGAGIALDVSFAATTAPDPAAPRGTPTAPAAPGATPTTGAPAARCTVPKVKGRTRASAEARLRARGCAPATTIVRRYSGGVRKGRVIGTTPGTGRQTARPVMLIVSKGRRPARGRPLSHPADKRT